jgi:hypothetical protein
MCASKWNIHWRECNVPNSTAFFLICLLSLHCIITPRAPVFSRLQTLEVQGPLLSNAETSSLNCLANPHIVLLAGVHQVLKCAQNVGSVSTRNSTFTFCQQHASHSLLSCNLHCYNNGNNTTIFCLNLFLRLGSSNKQHKWVKTFNLSYLIDLINHAEKGCIMNIKENFHIYAYIQCNRLIHEQRAHKDIHRNTPFDTAMTYIDTAS